LEMAKNISNTHRKLWRPQDDNAGVGVHTVALNYLDIEAEDYVEMREDFVQTLNKQQRP
jgi:hypothetical protein